MLSERNEGQNKQEGREEDPKALTEEIPAIKSVENVHVRTQTLNEKFCKFERTVSLSVPVNDEGTKALENGTLTNISKNEPVKVVSHARGETTSRGQERSERKRCETNLTPVSIRRKLCSIEYVPGKDKASKFCDKFEEVIRNFENLPETNAFSDEEKRDAFYNAIMATFSEGQAAEFMAQTNTAKNLNYDQLKTFFLRAEVNKKQGEMACPRAALKSQKRDPNDRCFEDNDYGRFERDWSYKDSGLKKCYKCNEFETHKATECPKKFVQLKIKASAGRGRDFTKTNDQYGNFEQHHPGAKFFNNKTTGLKRKFYDNKRGSEAKKPKDIDNKNISNSNYNAKNEKVG